MKKFTENFTFRELVQMVVVLVLILAVGFLIVANVVIALDLSQYLK